MNNAEDVHTVGWTFITHLVHRQVMVESNKNTSYKEDDETTLQTWVQAELRSTLLYRCDED